MPILIKGSGGGSTAKGTLSITKNGLHDVTNYQYAEVSVPIDFKVVENPSISTYTDSTNGLCLRFNAPIWLTNDPADVLAVGLSFEYYWNNGLDRRTMNVFLRPDMPGFLWVDAGDGEGLYSRQIMLNGQDIGIGFATMGIDFFALDDKNAIGRFIIAK